MQREKGTYTKETIVIIDDKKHIKKTTEIVGRNNITLSYTNEYFPPIKFKSAKLK